MRNDWVGLLNTDPRGISQDGLTLASFTTAASIFPDVTIPANFLKDGRTLNIKCRGIWAATATPTYTFSIKVGSVVVVTSAAITVSAIASQAWALDVDIQTRTEGTSGTLYGIGDLTMGGVTGDIFLPATGTAPAASSAIDLTVSQALAVQIACGTSNAANTVKGIHERILAVN